MNFYDIGDAIRLSATFTVGGVATDPTTLTLRIKAPGGTETTYTYGTDAALVKDSVGVYHLDYLPPVAGGYTYRWAGTGAAQAASETPFSVRLSAFG